MTKPVDHACMIMGFLAGDLAQVFSHFVIILVKSPPLCHSSKKGVGEWGFTIILSNFWELYKFWKSMINIVKQIEYWKGSTLFGSYARNQAREDSDIDILLVSDAFDTDDDVILSRPWSPKYRKDYRIEPISIGKKRFQTDQESIILDVVRNEGVEIQVSGGEA